MFLCNLPLKHAKNVSCSKVDLRVFPYNNIGNLFVSKFCPRTLHWCSRVANFTRDGNTIISENYIVIVGEKVLLWP